MGNFGRKRKSKINTRRNPKGSRISKKKMKEAAEENTIDIELLDALQDHMQFGDVDDLVEFHNDNHAGQWNSLEDFAENLMEETGDLDSIPENLRYYFDFEKYARDLDLSGDIFIVEVNYDTHVYWNR